MRTKQTTLATAIALSLATSGLVASGQVWADTSTRSLKAVIDRAPASDGTITINAGETINLAALGIDQEGKVDTRGEQLGAVIFMSVATDKGEIFVGSDTPGERENNPEPLVGGFALLPPGEKPFNNLKYIRLIQGAGRAHIYYPPTINTPPIVEPTATDNRQYDECCGLPCADKLPPDTLNCPTDTRPEDAVKLEPVVENVKVTLQERFLNKSGGVEYKVIEQVSKKINIMPAIPHVRKLEIVKFEAGPRDRIGTRAVASCLAADKASKKCDDDPSDGIEGHMTAGVAGARVTVWALRDAPGQAKGLGKDPAANGKLVLKIVAVADRKTYKELPAVNMLNGEGQVTFPSDFTLAGDFYIEIELRLAVNGHMDTTNSLALPTVVNNVDMFTADKVIVEPTKKISKLKLESIKKVISDDANPPQGTPFNPGAASNAATQITVYALDEYGNKTLLPAGTPTKVTVTDGAGVLNAGSLNLNFNTADPNRKGPDMAKDWVGDAYGDVLKLGETSLTATIEGSGIAASDPLKVKVVAKNLAARPYAGSAVPGDTSYGDINGVPAANAPYPTSTTRYKPNTTNVIKDLQAGTSVKAFSVAVDGGRLNGIPNGLFDDYKSADGSILPNLADGANSDDDFVSKTSAAALVIKTPAGESVETTLAQPVYAVDATGAQVIQETVQADGTRGQGARVEVLFTKPVENPNPMGKYFIIGDKAGQYGEALVYLPGNIKPSAASKAKILNAHGYEPTAKDKNGKDKLDENGQPIIQLDARLDYPTKDGTFQVLLPAKNIKLGDEYGNSVSASAGGTFSPTSSNGAPKLVTLDQYGNPGTMMNTRSIRATAALPPGQTKADGTIDAYSLSYDAEKFAGTDRISLGFTSPGVKPRTVEVTVPPTPKLTTIKAEVEQSELPVNSIIAITVRSFDQNGFPIDALANTTVTFSGSILQTASIWRVANDNPKGAPTNLMNSGEVVRPEGGDQQVLVMNVGNKAGEFTLTFTNPNLAADATAQTITIKASDKYVPPAVCAKSTPVACTTEEMCTAASGTWTNDACQFEAVKDAAQCQKDGGIYTINKCYPVLGADNKPSGELVELEGASSAEGTYDSTKPEKANFYGGVMTTSGERTTDKFETPATVMLNDKVTVGGVIRIEDEDKGKKADLLATGYHVSDIYSNGFNWYMAVQCAGNDFVTVPTCPSYGWQIKPLPYDETGYPIFYELEPFKSVTLAGNPGDSNPAYQSFEMYKGNFPVTAEEKNPLRIYFGYMVTEGVNAGKVVYNGKPIEVIIKKPGQ